ncbi:MAG: hypothetical protein ABI687_04480 [Flavitalea sp.]
MPYLLIILTLLSSTLFAQKTEINIFIAGKGDWENAENWSLSRTPNSGDVIIIQESSMVIINKTVSLENADMSTAGQLRLNGGGLAFNEASRIIIAASGSIETSGSNEEENISIGKLMKFIGAKDGKIGGYAIAHSKTGESPEGFSVETFRSPNLFINKKGEWLNKESWSLSRIPEDGDSIIIPVNTAVALTEEQKFENVSLRISGQMELSKAGLDLGKPSTIVIEKTGMLISANNDENEKLIISDKIKFIGAKDKQVMGFAFASNKTGESPNGFTSESSLPLRFISLQAKRINRDILIEWTTDQEVNTLSFEVQESNNGASWRTIGTVYAADIPNQAHYYAFTRKNADEGLIYFRIRQIDKDQRSEYSRLIVFNTPAPAYTASISLVSRNTFLLRLTGDIKNDLKIRIVNMVGRIVYTGNAIAGATLIHSNAVWGGQKQVNILQLTDSKGYVFTSSFIAD